MSGCNVSCTTPYAHALTCASAAGRPDAPRCRPHGHLRPLPRGPFSDGPAAATNGWPKPNKPEVLDSKVEKAFRERGWLIVWTPPYCPKFQPIELVWGAGKERASGM